MKDFFKIISQNILAVFFLAIIVGSILFIVQRFPMRLDLTEEKEYTLSDSTKKILNKLQDRLTIRLHYSKELPPQLIPIKQRVSDLIQEIKSQSRESIFVEEVDPASDPDQEKNALASGILPMEFSSRKADKIEAQKIYMGMSLIYQDRREIIPFLANLNNLEYVIALNLLKVTSKQRPRLGLITNTRLEESYSLTQKISEYLCEVVPLQITDKNLDKFKLDTLLIINPIEAPASLAQEIDNLLAEGVSVVIFLGNLEVDNSMKVHPHKTGLEDWLSGLGVTLSDQILVDDSQAATAVFQEGILQFVREYPLWLKTKRENFNADHPITSRLEEILYPWTNFLEWNEKSDYKATILTRSSPASFALDDTVQDLSWRFLDQISNTQETNPHILSLVLEKEKSKIFLNTNAIMLRDEFFQQSQPNAVFLQNAIEFFSWGDELIGVRSRGRTTRPLEKELTQNQIDLLRRGLMIGVPFISILMVIFYSVYLKRKRHTKSINILQSRER